VLPVLLAVTTCATGGFAFLYFVRPGTGELGAIRVVVTDDDGKGGGTLRVVVAEAPLAQKETVSPGPAFTGVVHYPAPYLTKPNLKLTSGKRRYDVVEETPFGFTWAARPLPDDFRAEAKKDNNLFEKRIGHAAMETFLVLNGWELAVGVDEQEQVILRLAAGGLKREEFTAWVRSHLQRPG
jgi:death-on-curing protein